MLALYEDGFSESVIGVANNLLRTKIPWQGGHMLGHRMVLPLGSHPGDTPETYTTIAQASTVQVVRHDGTYEQPFHS